ncbi:hypothetical protein NEDG_01200 [Nematocida displodere]|uniref:Uncharacterized protein n=1 Tax=Nematocida displodere TaxID=1805483 RepID=A0A177EC25_9MICR|nr:hypothetical protein NEDG_01200 [Nematocida displodere]
MRASDFFRPPQLKLGREESEEYEVPLKESQEEWKRFANKFLTPPSHIEINIQTETELELARKDLEQKGIIKKERIEKKTREITTARTLKPSLLSAFAERISEALTYINQEEEREEENKAIVAYFKDSEFIKRKEGGLSVHVLGKTFLPISLIEQGAPESFILCKLLINGKDQVGYLTEKELQPFKTSVDGPASLERGIHALRDRAQNTSVLKEYLTETARARITREHLKPSTQSKHAVFLICALKTGLSFSIAINLLSQKI